MRHRSALKLIYFLLFSVYFVEVNGQEKIQFLFGDALPDAPELAQRGNYKVGVQTMVLTDKGRVDILKAKDGITPTYDRKLPIEIWYPATIPSGEKEIEIYQMSMGLLGDSTRPLIPFKFKGRALRDAQPKKAATAYPLVILSHGYPGSRLIWSYLGENLASKGYIVVSVDHTESTFEDVQHFKSTLLNRSLDQLFVLKEIDRLSKEGNKHFLTGLVDANNTGLIGYSMGGYGAINTTGGGYSNSAVQYFKSIAEGSDELVKRSTGNEAYLASIDNRIKATVAFAPWGMSYQVWDEMGLAGLTKPTFFVAGSQDDISMYDNGIKAMYEGAVNADRYLLTYVNARHNVAANPPPNASLEAGLHLDEYLRYGDSVWDTKRINNINQHFVTAFLGLHLKGENYGDYLDLPEDANTGNWKGFKPRTSIGMTLMHGSPKNK